MKIGILGDGQLARMLALSAYPLGFGVLCYGQDRSGSAGKVTNVMVGDYDNQETLREFLDQVDVLTYESENIPWQTVAMASNKFKNHTNWAALKSSQDRYVEKSCFQQLSIKTAPFCAVNSEQELRQAVQELGLPAVLKTRRFGYDGKGQQVLRSIGDISACWHAINQQPAILETFVNFDSELSIVAVRSQRGEIRCYDLAQNSHEEGILRLTQAPFTDQFLLQQATSIVTKLLNYLGYVGTFCVELFQQGDQLSVNEMSPRVHNSGHWTIEGARTCQFENHIRAITNLPLGRTSACGFSAMVNFITDQPAACDILAIPDAHYHCYGKSARPKRKLGHLTINTTDEQSRKDTLALFNKTLKTP